MKNNETWDDRFDLMNKPYLRYGVIIVDAAPFNIGVDSADAVILVSTPGGALTLPLAASKPHAAYYIKKVAAGADAEIFRSGADLIDGSALPLALPLQYDAVLLVSDGLTNWYVLSKSSAAVLPVT